MWNYRSSATTPKTTIATMCECWIRALPRSHSWEPTVTSDGRFTWNVKVSSAANSPSSRPIMLAWRQRWLVSVEEFPSNFYYYSKFSQIIQFPQTWAIGRFKFTCSSDRITCAMAHLSHRIGSWPHRRAFKANRRKSGRRCLVHWESAWRRRGRRREGLWVCMRS